MRNTKRNKVIGIIGGVGPQASSYLYTKIMKLAQAKYKAKDNDDFPELVLYSVPVPDFISDKKNIPQAMKMFEKVIEDFNKIEVSYIAVASNTVHLLIDDFRKLTAIKFVSLVDAVVEKIKQDGRKKVGLLSGSLTIKSGLYRKPLLKKGIKLIYPDKIDQKKVEKIIRAVIAGTNNGGLKKDYIKVVDGLFARGVEAIILGCTELPLAINYEAIGNKVYNSMDILAEKIVDVYYGGEI